MSAPGSRTARGVILMALAMLTVPIVDGIAKYLSVRYSPLYLGWARYAIASLIVVPIAAARGGGRVFPNAERTSHLLRTVFLIAAMTLYFVAISRIPLATAVSAYFVGPIIAVVLSIVMLRERMTARKAMSLALGAAGALIIVRPGGSLDPGILLALASGVCFAAYMIATRKAAVSSDPIQTLAFQCVVGTVLLTPQAIVFWSTPTSADLWFFLGLGAFSALSHTMSIVAFRYAEASTLAPLVYLELIGAALIGRIVFAETPSISTMLGAVLIVGGGALLLPRKD
jgi:drug/metabolite transporter (DMT)-like permease